MPQILTGGGGNHSLKSNKTIITNNHTNSSISSEKSGLRSHEQGNRTSRSLTKRVASLPDLSPKDEFAPKFYFICGIIFNLCLLAFFKYTDFLLENFNAFSKLAHLDFNIPLPHILLPLALSFVTFQQIAFLFDCYKRIKGELDENLHIDFIDYALFISFFPQLIAGPIVHHREMMPQFAKMGANSACGDFSRSASAHFVNGRQSPISSFASHNHENSLTILEFDSCSGIAKNGKNNPSLRGEAEAIQTKEIDCHDLTSSSLAMTEKSADSRGSIFDEKSGLRSHERGNRTNGSLTKRVASLPDLSQKDNAHSTINYEFLAKGIFIFSIGLFKKAFIADSFAKWANAGFSVVESGGFLNIAESWATSLSYTFQLYFDFSGYCDMAIGLALMFGIVLPLNFDSPYKSLNISEFWRRWHRTLGRFLRECLYIPLGGNRGKGNSSLTQSSRELEKSAFNRQQVLSQADFPTQPTNLTQDTRIANDSQKQSYITKILTLRNLFIVAFLSGIWHGAGWGFVIWGVLHGVAMIVHRIYSWILERNLSFGNKSYRHTDPEQSEREVSKSRDFNQIKDTMSQKRINKSHKFTQSKKIANDSQVAKVDSSLHASRSTQNDKKLIFTQTRFYKVLCWFITFNFVNIAWIFFRSENLNGAVNLIKGMFGVVWVELPQKWHRMPETLAQIDGRNDTIFYIIIAFIVCLACRNSFEMVKNFDTQYLRFRFSLRVFSKKIYLKGGAVWTRFVLTITLFYTSIWILLKNVLDSNAYTPFLYFNF